LPTNEFKPGDRVKCVIADGTIGDIECGVVYTIKSLGTYEWVGAVYLSHQKEGELPYYKWRFEKMPNRKRINYRTLLKKRK